MKQFNLQEYLKNPDRKIETRDGRSARILCVNRINDAFPIVALIRNSDMEEVRTYTKDGKYRQDKNDNLDLFFAPIKKEGWINIYHHEGLNSTSSKGIFDTKEEALKLRLKNCVDTVQIEWEE